MSDYTFLLMVSTESQGKQAAADDVIAALADWSIAASLHTPGSAIEQLEAQVEALQNKCANRGLSPEDSDRLQAENERLQTAINNAVDVYTDDKPDPARRMYELLGAHCSESE